MKRLVVLGGGESGVGAACLGKEKGFKVFVSDNNTIAKAHKDVLLNYEIEFEEEKHTASKILNADVVMKSPGIPETVPLVKQIRAEGISIISEIELASRYTDAMLIAITGSNGKTTTASLTHHLLKTELNVGLAGNIGDSFAKQVLTFDYTHYVLEVSSFQLDDIERFKPQIAILTNITPDHLDRYNYQFENYIASKFRIVENQTSDDVFIYDADDEVISGWIKNNPIQSKLLPFSLTKTIEQGAYLKNKNKFD